MMYVFEYLVYHLKPYGISTKLIKPGVSFEQAKPKPDARSAEAVENVDILEKIVPVNKDAVAGGAQVDTQLVPDTEENVSQDKDNPVAHEVVPKKPQAMDLDQVLKYKQEQKKIHLPEVLGNGKMKKTKNLSSAERLKNNVV